MSCFCRCIGHLLVGYWRDYSSGCVSVMVMAFPGIGSGVAMISMGMAAEEQKQQQQHGAMLAHSPLEKKVCLQTVCIICGYSAKLFVCTCHFCERCAWNSPACRYMRVNFSEPPNGRLWSVVHDLPHPLPQENSSPRTFCCSGGLAGVLTGDKVLLALQHVC